MTMTVEMRPIESIKVGDRVRETFGDLQELVDSMRERGQINPITIKDEAPSSQGNVAGGPRGNLAGKRSPARCGQEDEGDELLAVEIEENTCRAQLTLVEAERAWRKYRVLLGIPEETNKNERCGEAFTAQ